MTANHDLERRLADFYVIEAPRRAPDRLLEGALATIDTTRQRRELSLVPWRFPTMNVYAKLAVAAVVALAVGALGLTLLRPAPGPLVGGPHPSSTPAPSFSPVPSSNPSLAPTLTETYTSTVHGVTISYPAGWATAPASVPEPGPSMEPGFLSPAGDFLYEPALRDHLFLAIGSEALDGRAGDAWATAAFAADGDCSSEPRAIAVDETPALICDTLALTWVGDRGYSIRLHVSTDNPAVPAIYHEAWFEDVLATVQLPDAR